MVSPEAVIHISGGLRRDRDDDVEHFLVLAFGIVGLGHVSGDWPSDIAGFLLLLLFQYGGLLHRAHNCIAASA